MSILNKCWSVVTLFMLGVVLAVPSAHALPVNPDPSTFGADNGARLFRTLGSSLSVEFFDGGYAFGSAFGFYYNSTPSSLFTIFGPDDQDTSGGLSQVATIDFVNGVVYDYDESLANGSTVVETVFAPQNDLISFFFLVSNTLLFGDNNLNAGGADLSAVFPELMGGGYLIGFENPVTSAPLSYHYISGIEAVPEPSTIFLTIIGLLGLSFGKWRKGEACR